MLGTGTKTVKIFFDRMKIVCRWKGEVGCWLLSRLRKLSAGFRFAQVAGCCPDFASSVRDFASLKLLVTCCLLLACPPKALARGWMAGCLLLVSDHRSPTTDYQPPLAMPISATRFRSGNRGIFCGRNNFV